MLVISTLGVTVDFCCTQDFAINYWLDGGCPKEKIMVGMATYGRAWTLEDPEQHCLACPTKGAAPAGQFTREGGFYAYYEVR